MKKKYIAMVALSCWLLVSAWLGSMVVAKPAVFFQRNDAVESPEAAQLRAAIQRNTMLLEAATTLRPPQSSLSTTTLIATPAQAELGKPGFSNASEVLNEEVAPPALTLVIASNGGKTAIVDGAPVRVGSRLANGTRVSSIGDTWIRTTGPDGQRTTIKLRNIGDAARAGSVQ